MSRGIRADHVQREPVEWHWEERIPRGMISLVAGLPGVGKSLFGYHLAARASHTGCVIYSTYEESLRKTARARLEAAGAQLSNVHFWTPELPRDTDKLAVEIERSGVELVVLDPVAAHLSVSIYNDQDVRRALSPLKVVTEETNAGALLIAHTVKSPRPGSHPMDAIGGSGGGLRGAARMLFLFGRSPHDPDELLLACVKSNIGPEPPAYGFQIDVHEFVDVGEVAYLVELGERGDSLAEARIMLDTSRSEERPATKRAEASAFVVTLSPLWPAPRSRTQGGREAIRTQLGDGSPGRERTRNRTPCGWTELEVGASSRLARRTRRGHE